MAMSPSIYILYHFFYPDTVVSAEHKKELAQGLVARGWDVTVLTSNRFCRDQEHEINKVNHPCPSCGEPLIACSMCTMEYSDGCGGCPDGTSKNYDVDIDKLI